MNTATCPAEEVRISDSIDEQWRADLETLARLEEQALYPDACFFCQVGELIRERMEGRVA